MNFGSSKRSYSENPIKESSADHACDFHKFEFSLISEIQYLNPKAEWEENWDEKGIIFSRESMKNAGRAHTPLHDCKMKTRQFANLKE